MLYLLSGSGLHQCEVPHPQMFTQVSFLMEESIPTSPAAFLWTPRQVMFSLFSTIHLYSFGDEAGAVSSPGPGGAAEILPYMHPAPKEVCHLASSAQDHYSFMTITYSTDQKRTLHSLQHQF